MLHSRRGGQAALLRCDGRAGLQSSGSGPGGCLTRPGSRSCGERQKVPEARGGCGGSQPASVTAGIGAGCGGGPGMAGTPGELTDGLEE